MDHHGREARAVGILAMHPVGLQKKIIDSGDDHRVRIVV
jgi:hypothetical protein